MWEPPLLAVAHPSYCRAFPSLLLCSFCRCTPFAVFVAFSIAAQFARFPAAAISVPMAAVQQAPAEGTEIDQLSRIRLELATLDQIRCVFRRPHFRLLWLFVCFYFVCISVFCFFISIPVLFCDKWNFSNVSVWSGFLKKSKIQSLLEVSVATM
jgi:hypothetical protein